ncbi:MAG: 7,8-dihydroneopterin aldolase/epimerase/oxygenase [Clostridia bacterium]|jgi:dihydroneopterin aldolase|nr:7,8-dihydroneopterin aldolase/epimerase/oxygenase [Clostridia bacterium]MDN5322524.1 7,8-dihydroneopterin aldolase/epimerase/oxygenase [Clostridia bacterium]
MDKIIMKNLAFYGYHGVLKAENQLGQKFFIDVEIELDLKEAGKTDDVEKTVNYAEIYEVIKDIILNQRFNLIEALAENIAENILQKFTKVEQVVINVRKPEAPVKGIFDYFGVEIRRMRNG